MPDETQFPTFDASRVIGPQTDIPIPDEIGGFRILSLLGRGGMGIHARVDLYKKWGKPERARELEAELTPAKPAP